MIKGMYRSASGMLPRVKQQEAIANNVSNAGTTGFKKDIVFAKELSKAESRTKPQDNNWKQTLEARVQVDYTLGVFDKTDNPLDMAIEGDGFFVLQAPDGSTALTRAGSFVVDNEGYLAFSGGYRLMGDGGPIQVGTGAVTVGESGEVQSAGTTAGRVVPKTVADVTKLDRLGGAMFGVPAGEQLIAPLQASIKQGYVETSNVDVVQEMVDMMVAYRTYESNAKALQTQEATLDHLFQRVAKK
jgi:flagellar basal-body rod protein FlgF